MRRLPSYTDPQAEALLSVLGDTSFLLSQGDFAFSFFSQMAGSISTVRFGLQCACVCPTLCNPMNYSPHQTPLSMEFSRQEYWSGLPFPSSGHLPDSGIEPTSSVSPALSGRFFTTSATWEALGSNEASANSPWEGHPSPSAHSLLLSFFSLAVGAMCPLIPPEYKLRDNRHLICLIYHSSLHAQDHCLAYFRTVGSV